MRLACVLLLGFAEGSGYGKCDIPRISVESLPVDHRLYPESFDLIYLFCYAIDING